MSQPRSLYVAALLVIPALLLSGPAGALVAWWLHPQPEWRDVATFAAHYHPIQLLPYACGFVLVGACAWFVTSAIGLGGRPRPAALVATSVFAALITFNYSMQLGFVPAAARADSELAGALAMANPHSIAWVLEMTGYAAFGVATWIVAPVFAGGGRARWIRGLLVANGAVSVASALATYVSTAWIMTPVGVASYALWNALVIAAMVLVALEARRRELHDV
jgi:hypothetical protein